MSVCGNPFTNIFTPFPFPIIQAQSGLINSTKLQVPVSLFTPNAIIVDTILPSEVGDTLLNVIVGASPNAVSKSVIVSG